MNKPNWFIQFIILNLFSTRVRAVEMTQRLQKLENSLQNLGLQLSSPNIKKKPSNVVTTCIWVTIFFQCDAVPVAGVRPWHLVFWPIVRPSLAVINSRAWCRYLTDFSLGTFAVPLAPKVCLQEIVVSLKIVLLALWRGRRRVEKYFLSVHLSEHNYYWL